MKRQDHANLKSRSAAARVKLLSVGYETPELMRMSYFQLEALVRQNAEAIERHENKIRMIRERTAAKTDRQLAYAEQQREAEEFRLARISKPVPAIPSSGVIVNARTRQEKVRLVRGFLAEAQREFVRHGGADRADAALFWQKELKQLEGVK